LTNSVRRRAQKVLTEDEIVAAIYWLRRVLREPSILDAKADKPVTS
jgi:hypothetical protein